MGTYNKSFTTLKCPRCYEMIDVEIQWHFGFTSMMQEIAIGDKYPWKDRCAVQNGGRPKEGNVEGKGYSQCPKCEKDFWLKAVVRNDILEEITVDCENKPYIL